MSNIGSRLDRLEKITVNERPRIVWVETGAPRSPEFTNGSTGPVLLVGWMDGSAEKQH